MAAETTAEATDVTARSTKTTWAKLDGHNHLAPNTATPSQDARGELARYAEIL